MEKIVFDDKSQLKSNEYTVLFYSDLALRPCCYSCKYSTYKRISDFTVGDYWGVEKYNSDFYDDKGISILILNTPKAQELRQVISKNCSVVTSDVQKAQQHNTIMPTLCPKYRESYWKKLKAKGFESSLKSFTQYGGFWFKIRRKIYKFTGRWY